MWVDWGLDQHAVCSIACKERAVGRQERMRVAWVQLGCAALQLRPHAPAGTAQLRAGFAAVLTMRPRRSPSLADRRPLQPVCVSVWCGLGQAIRHVRPGHEAPRDR
jgi:hypothetical protein